MSTAGKYHINNVTGRPNICRATKRGCPMGSGESEHYATREEAQAAYEKSMGEQSAPSLKKTKKKPTKNAPHNYDFTDAVRDGGSSEEMHREVMYGYHYHRDEGNMQAMEYIGGAKAKVEWISYKLSHDYGETQLVGLGYSDNGKYLVAVGGADFTGWDCQSSLDLSAHDSAQGAIDYGLTRPDAQKLNIRKEISILNKSTSGE